MKRLAVYVGLSVALGMGSSGPVEAFTSKEKVTISVEASGVAESTTFDADNIVTQGSGEPGTAATLGFGLAGNALRDSGEAIRVDVTTNLAANRLIISTDNRKAAADPKACNSSDQKISPEKGFDGGGLVGLTDCATAVPVVWAVRDNNEDYAFTPNAVQPSFQATGASNAVFVTDRAHAATFTTKDGALDNQAMKRCSNNAPVTNTAGDGLYPQFFGREGDNHDLCDQATGEKIREAEELSKNIAVVAFGFLGTSGTAPDVTTPVASDTISVTSPIFVPIAADFRDATAQNYSTNTLTVELVTQ